MPSPTAGLFGGLAQGIFGRMQEHEDEQRKLDLDEKKTALTSLSALLEHATPETRPILYKQMSDVMGLKGKHRGVWDMLTGGGRDDYHRQLSAKLDGVFGNVMGPKAYEDATTAAPTSGNQADWGDESAGLTYTPPAGKIALRDPIAEHLTALKSQYGLQNDRRSQEIELRNRLAGEREAANDERDATNKLKDREVAAQIAAEKKVRAIATAFALKRQSKIPSDEEFAMAAEQVAAMDGLNVDKLKAQIGFLNSGSKLNEARATSTDGGERPITPFQQYGIDDKKQARGIEVYDKFKSALGKINEIGKTQTTLRNQLTSINPLTGMPDPQKSFQFNEQEGSFTGPNGPVKFISPVVQKMITQLRESEADKVRLRTDLDSQRDILKTYHDKQFDIKDDWTVVPKAQYESSGAGGEVINATTPRGTKKFIPGQITVPRKTNDPSYDRNEGDVINYLGKQYRVHEVLPPGGGMEFGGVVLIPLGKGK